MYDVNEVELSTVHQDENGSDNELGVQDDVDDGLDEPTPVHRRVGGQKSTVPGNLQVLINRREEDMVVTVTLKAVKMILSLSILVTMIGIPWNVMMMIRLAVICSCLNLGC